MSEEELNAIPMGMASCQPRGWDKDQRAWGKEILGQEMFEKQH